MKYLKYQKVRRLATADTYGVLEGMVYVFYKIDGTNASTWLQDDGTIGAGSRNRELSIEQDNAGFFNTITRDENIIKFHNDNKALRLYGEWLVPHTLRTYRESAWRQFYVFDVMDDDGNYMPYDEYKVLLEAYGINYVPPVAILKNPTTESVYDLLEKSGQFLVKDGEGNGEGIVCKNYDYRNKYDSQTWAKVIANEFKEKHTKTMGAPVVTVSAPVEEKIVTDFCTEAFIRKEHAKIVNDNGGEWETKLIPRLLHQVYYELVTEEIWNIMKTYKKPTVNFGFLNGLVIRKVKAVFNELF